MSIATSPGDRRRDRLEAAFTEAEARAQRTAGRTILVAIAVIAVWITWENTFPAVLYYYPFLLGFALVNAGPAFLWRRRRAPAWERYARFMLGIALYTVMVLTPNPFEEDVRTQAMLLRWQNEIYLFLFVAGSVFTYSPRVVLCTGVTGALCWSLAALWTLQQPGVVGNIGPEAFHSMSLQQQRLALMDPNHVFINGVIRLDLVLLLTSVALAAFVRRSRQIVAGQAEAERERANLSRYFSPNRVEELAQSDLPLATTRRQDAAVLFIDIVGFTSMSEHMPPEGVIETLRQFHHRVERSVFAHEGTLEKFIGDGAMATFGTPRPGPHDASNALRCTATLLSALEELNRQRASQGLESIRFGIGVHYGSVVLGDIGGEQRLEFAVLGDTVNVASRLEHLTRQMDAVAVLSGDLIDAVQREGADPSTLLPGLGQVPSQSVRGRDQPLRLWTYAASRGRESVS